MPAATAQYFDVREGNDAYNRAEYDKAKESYDKVVTEHPELLEQKEAIFNNGNVAFRQEKYDDAQARYEEIAANPKVDDKLRSEAYYNSGNTFYKKSEAAQQSSEKMKLMESALAQYKSALSLNPTDDEAKMNFEFTKKELDKLREQMKQNQQNQQNQKKQNQQKQQQQDQQKQDQQNQDQQKQDQQNQDQQQQDQQKNQDQQNQDQQNQAQPQPMQFSKKQAERLLDALKQDEKNMLKKYQQRPATVVKPEKDW
ncbi:conserved hypothetical protein [Chloroherpeton thalassium ATCC 35110]|uniref:Tetratricopeptide TPR_2 repeat protein n=1 Tax=Chloroherpeton thalassium (strain ATCC 35110 / GB-78) TaxID=517418 RepID=B3QY77_CHLT3|nr:hypothetical protein [Chloroherpeton thalassium]ACF15043.1 conserved hypothetical protein [Chloroherpeton thalassium ATCC 35110]